MGEEVDNRFNDSAKKYMNQDDPKEELQVIRAFLKNIGAENYEVSSILIYLHPDWKELVCNMAW